VEGGRVHRGGKFGEVSDPHADDGGQWLRRARRGGGPEHEDRVEQALAGERQPRGPGVWREVGPGGDQHAGTGAAEEFGEVRPR
jgi:hypothetical protein